MQFPHQALPDRPHDHAARQDFLASLRQELTGPLADGNRVVFVRRAAPRARRETGVAPADRHAVRQAMLNDTFHQTWSSLMRATQEILFEEVSAWAERAPSGQHRDLSKATLRLDPALVPPRYLTGVDTHCMPGGYFAGSGEAHAEAKGGLVYDRAVYLYMMGRLGPKSDACGRILSNYVKETYPDLAPKRILDVGCGVGHATLPYAAAFPGAELHALDVSAPMLRYAQARADAFDIPVHFAQQNAEKTDYDNSSFDLVVSHIVLHETSSPALRRIFAEGRRLLAPGGLMLHAEGTGFANKPLIDQYLADWDTYFNNEPFIGALHDTDLRRILVEAGFSADEVILTYSGAGHARHAGGGLLLVGGRRSD